MKIGIFDSGLGGLLIAHALKNDLGRYDYLYLGDSANLPYGEKTKDQIYELSRRAIDWLFRNDCKLVVVACNSASSDALRRIQQEFIPNNWPDRKALGVLIPSAEVAVEKGKTIGIICTNATASSGTFEYEINKLASDVALICQPTPELVDCIESGQIKMAQDYLDGYLQAMKARGIDSLVLGCTHYPVLKEHARKVLGPGVAVISQDEIIPAKLLDYLSRHPEIKSTLSQSKSIRFFVTKKTVASSSFAQKLFTEAVDLEPISLR